MIVDGASQPHGQQGEHVLLGPVLQRPPASLRLGPSSRSATSDPSRPPASSRLGPSGTPVNRRTASAAVNSSTFSPLPSITLLGQAFPSSRSTTFSFSFPLSFSLVPRPSLPAELLPHSELLPQRSPELPASSPELPPFLSSPSPPFLSLPLRLTPRTQAEHHLPSLFLSASRPGPKPSASFPLSFPLSFSLHGTQAEPPDQPAFVPASPQPCSRLRIHPSFKSSDSAPEYDSTTLADNSRVGNRRLCPGQFNPCGRTRRLPGASPSLPASSAIRDGLSSAPRCFSQSFGLVGHPCGLSSAPGLHASWPRSPPMTAPGLHASQLPTSMHHGSRPPRIKHTSPTTAPGLRASSTASSVYPRWPLAFCSSPKPLPCQRPSRQQQSSTASTAESS